MARAKFKTVTAGVRAPRLAILVEDPDPYWGESCRRVIETLSSVWGGHYSVIVPTDGRTIAPVFWDILEAFDADYVCAYHKTGLDWKLGAPQLYEQVLEQHLRQRYGSGPYTPEQREELDADIVKSPLSQKAIQPILEAEIKARLAPFFFDESVVHIASLSTHDPPGYPLTSLSTVLPHCELPTVFSTVEAQIDGVPSLWVESVLGATYEARKHEFAQTGVTLRHLQFTDTDANGLFKVVMRTESRPDRTETVKSTGTHAVPILDILSTCPFRFSSLGLSQYRSTKQRRWETPGIVIVGETLSDFALFFGLSRVRTHVYWLLPEWIEEHRKYQAEVAEAAEKRARRVTEAHATNFAHRLLRGLTSSSFKRLAFVSLSHDAPALEGIVDELDAALMFRPPDTRPIRDGAAFPKGILELLSEPEVVFNTDNFAIPTTHQIEEGEPAGFFPTPKPKGFTQIVPYDHRWITELRIEDHSYPRHPGLGEWLLRHHLLSTQDVRSGARGICYGCPSPAYFGGDVDTILVRPKVYVPDGRDVFEYLVSSVGWKSRISDKGFYSSDSIAKFGSLAEVAAALRDPVRSAVFSAYLLEGKSSSHGKYLSTDRRRYLDLPAVTTLLGTEDAAVLFIDELIQKRVLHRGLILKCDFCRNADWFAVADVSDGFTCKRCRRSQPILSRHALQQPEPRWFYQLDEITYQGLRSNMHVPLLALDCLRRRSSAFLYCDELEVSEAGSPKPIMELDICCISDGVLTIGEAKVTERIEGGGAKEMKSLLKYKDMAVKLGARRFVYATSKVWSAQTSANVSTVFADTSIDVLPLTEKDLYS